MSSSPLHEIACRHGGGKDEHLYCNFYHRHLEPLQKRPDLRILELGVSRGNSLRIWQDYFPNAKLIAGIDKNMVNFVGNHQSFHLYQFDLRVAGMLEVFAKQNENWDLIVDDAGHHVVDTQRTFDLLWPRLNPGGIMILEDLQTNWLPHCNPFNQPSTYRFCCAMRDGTQFDSAFLPSKRVDEYRQSVANVEVWVRRKNEDEGTIDTVADMSNYDSECSITAVFVKKEE